jgi:hypothetical protein
MKDVLMVVMMVVMKAVMTVVLKDDLKALQRVALMVVMKGKMK